MALYLTKLGTRQLLPFAAALLVSAYALAVLYHVQTTPEIGVRCAFKTIIIRVDVHYLRADSDQIPPAQRDEIVRVGDRFTPTWTHFLRAVIEESKVDSSLTGTHRWTQGEHQVLLRFRQANATADEPDRSCWCRIDTPPLPDLVPSALWLVLKFSLFLVGAFVFWKRPEDRSATLFFWFCILSVGAYMGGYHWARITTEPVLLVPFIVCGVLLPVVTLHFFLVFPRPKQFFMRWPRRGMAAIYGLPLCFLAVMLGYYAFVRGLYQSQSVQELNTALWDFRTVIYCYLATAGLWYVASVVALIHSFRTSQDVTERNQVKWLLCGAAVALLPITWTLILAAWKPHDFGSGGATWPMFAASALVTLAFAVSITRYRLMQLDQILSSGMLYFAISTVAGLVYYGVVLLAVVLVGSQVMDGPSFQQALWAGVTVLVLLLVLDVARNRLRRVLDRSFHKEKYQLDRTLRRMGQAIEQLVDPPTLARRLLQASADLLGASRGAVYLREAETSIYRLVGWLGTEPALNELSPGCPVVERLVQRGFLVLTPRPNAGDLPAQRQLHLLGGVAARALSHEGQLLALLLLGPKETGPYTVEDLNLLSEFAQLTALALESAERHQTIEGLNRDLRDKVEKIAEQQRRILALQSQLQAGVRTHLPPPDSADASASPAGAGSPSGIVGASAVMQQLFHLVRKVAASESAVLIRGESGTGKELLARALHEQGPRAGKPFVKVHCAALSSGLLESELFGHVKGAYTGAHRDKVGRFELASGGTLFLDEIGDISLDVQTKLLRVLQEMTFERVGSSESIEVDVRVIAATHQELERLMDQGKFREDLFYRLNVISLLMPPLRDRREDIPELAQHFLRLYSQKSGKGVSQMEDDALVVLKSHAWPGNIRELENVVERAVVIADGETVTVRDLPAELVEASEATPSVLLPSMLADEPSQGNLPPGLLAERAERDRRERERLVRALAAARGNKAEAARTLGLARSTLVSRLKKHGLS